MKKIQILVASIIAFASMMACNPDLQSTYKEFLGDGENIYVGKLTDVELFSGNQRFLICGSTRYMNTAKRLHISLLDTDYDYMVDVDPTLDTFEYYCDNLPAGNYYVEISSIDKDGNTSVPEIYNIDVYDVSSLKNFATKKVLKASFVPLQCTMDVSFNTVDEATSVRLVYTDADGKEQSVELDGDVKEYAIDSWTEESDVNVYTRVLPFANALDEIEILEPATFTLPSVPEEMELPRSYWQWPGCSSDTWGTQYGGSIPTLWDNRYGDQEAGYHTGDTSYEVRGVPSHVTIDLGVRACCTRGRIMFRPCPPWTDWPAKHFEIWGHPNGNPAEFLEITDKYDTPVGQFEAESLAKGWVKIADYYPEEEKLAAYQFIDFPMFSEHENIRYLRYRCVEGWKNGGVGAGVYSMATEMWFWGKTTKILYLED